MIAKTAAENQTVSAPYTTVWWLTFVLVSYVLFVPIFSVELPPLLDYPNHLARMDVLAHSQSDPDLGRMYRVSWRIVPNIGIDVTMPILMRFIPLLAAGKVFLGLAIFLPFAGVIALHYALFRRLSYWPFAAAFIVYNRLFFLGFMNFEMGIGLALIAAALWHLMRDRPPSRLVVASFLAIVIFFCHLIALAFFALILFSLEVSPIRRLRSIEAKTMLVPILPFVVPALLYLQTPMSGAAADSPDGIVGAVKHYYWELVGEHGLKPLGFFGAFLTYSRGLDMAAVFLVITLVGVCAAMGKLRLALPLVWAGGLLFILYPFTPFRMMNTAWIDQRLPVMMSFLLIAAVSPEIPKRPYILAIAALFGTVLVSREIAIRSIWVQHDEAVAEFRKDITVVATNERVLVIRPDKNPDRSAAVNNPDNLTEMLEVDATLHLPALLVIDRRAFWPLLFTAAAKQPVSVVPPYDAISMPEGLTPQVKDLANPSAYALESAPYLKNWPATFDWVLLLRPSAVPNSADLLPDRLRLVRSGQLAALYRVQK